ncbi:stressosome-associated protein Prli42 [Melghiribacillus thermohalophilus]|nr:stressosome-associated protein Prli42 [Melghiribacillus thermohalophilus]
MSKKKNKPNQVSYPGTSKRQRRLKFVIYLMIISMFLSAILTGAVMFL